MQPDDLTVDELLLIVGAERHDHSPDEVADAEERLRRWASAWPELSVRHLRLWALVAAALGLGVATTDILNHLQSLGFAASLAPELRGAGGVPTLLAAVVARAVPGWLLMAGGIAVWWRKEPARVTVVLAAWGLIALRVLAGANLLLASGLFAPAFLPVFAHSGPGLPLSMISLAVAPVLMTVLLFLLTRYFSSREAKALCRPPGMSESECKLRAIGGLSAAGGVLICGWWAYSQVSAFAAAWDLPEIGWSWLAAIGGVVMVLGGFGLRGRREWARRTLLATAWALLALGALLAVVLVAQAVGSMEWRGTAVLLALLLPALVIDIAALVVLVLLSRYLASGTVKALCRD